MVLSLLACVALLLAQIGAYVEFALVPAATSATTGPQGPADLVSGLLSLVGGGLGFALSIASGVIGLAVASAEHRRFWVLAISASAALVVVGLAVSAFVLLGLTRNPYHPFVIFGLVPVTSLVYLFATRARARN